MSELEHAAKALRALGDPTRLRIVSFVREILAASGGQPIGPTVALICLDVTGSLKHSSRISFHLRVLREAGILFVHGNGKHQHYCLDSQMLDRLAGHLNWVTDRRAGSI